jgi:hypothetical protein
MDIDNLQAGRELDALVAEKVMGWDVLRYDNGTIVIVERDDKDGIFCNQIDADDTINHAIWWSPSTRINDTWRVVNKFCNDWEWEIGYGEVTGQEAMGWYAMLIPLDTEKDNWLVENWPFAYGDTAPLAICRAALKAMVTLRRMAKHPCLLYVGRR